ncbi:MAG: orotate phosphoribosyltransferase, partial [Candidatus Delongbacteria bacterium]|nr:orotate phosphoribosyltransferase [Candidatus Delongbacteria bacterium]
AINKLGRFYAETIADRVKVDYGVIFGPAYKGIPLAVSCASSLFAHFGIDKDYSFNRKEAKEHGDASGIIVGKPLTKDDKLILIDDVVTAGTAIRETIEILKQVGSPKIVSIVVSVDRMEKGMGELSAIQELKNDLGVEFYPIVNIIEIMEYLKTKKIVADDIYDKMVEYRKKYGIE